MADDLAIDLHHVAKTYRKRIHALRGVTMQVRRGEIFGLLGPNGAGKSTLVKIMMTVVRPTRADGLILGRPVGHKGTLARVGYLPENHRFPRYLTGRQTIEFFAAMSKVDHQTSRRRTRELLETVRMTEWADQKISTYSKGMLQRIGLAQALVNDPDLVLLDEPTDGVDPVGRREILDVLGRMRAEGKTVFINSHALSELESICDRIAILTHGQVASQGTLDELTFARQRYEIEVVMTDWAADRRLILSLIPASWQELPAPALAQPMWRTQPPAISAAANMPLGYAPTAAHGPPVLTPPGPRILDRGKADRGQWMELRGPVLQIGTSEPSEIQETLDVLRAHFVICRVEQVRPSLEDLFMEAITDPATGRFAGPGAAPHAAAPQGGRP